MSKKDTGKKDPPVIEAKRVTKVYLDSGKASVTALKDVDLEIKKGSFTAIMGASGSGKTTLLDVLGLLLKPTSGKVFIDGKEIDYSDDNRLARIRREKIGFIFQQYNLLSSGTALENVELPMRIKGVSKRDARERSHKLLTKLGLGKRTKHRPGELSGGEQQRVAIARALANDPEVILADEPTGNLDSKTGKIIMELLKQLNKRSGYTIVMITHERALTKYAERVIELRDGMRVKR